MNLKDACDALVRVEREYDTESLNCDGVNVWPIVRHCIWFLLLESDKKVVSSEKYDFSLIDQLKAYSRSVLSRCKSASNQLFNKRGTGVNGEYLFISRPVYLQKLSSGLLFDRILDPLLFLSRNKYSSDKFYIGNVSGASLFFSANMIAPKKVKYIKPSEDLISALKVIAGIARLDSSKLTHRFHVVFHEFRSWYATAEEVIRNSPNLKRIYVTSWYFPDMMAFITVANHMGIETIDVQHGKQGKYQGMYSWWTAVPQSGYELLPDKFWCWGKPSCDHIMESGGKRDHHLPFTGGFPWMEYYKKYISESNVNRGMGDKKINILVTLQSPISDNAEPIPDFLVDFLLSDAASNVRINFRCHPNYPDCISYSRSRLLSVQPGRYVITDGKNNLYDELLDSTHHITAYSSCCYEASVFNVPTLLFGADAASLYSDEIESGEFDWTAGSVADLESWLERSFKKRSEHESDFPPEQYIVSSLCLAKEMIAS